MSRRGKKMGTFHVNMKDSAQPLADVEYRFDSKAGKFFAEFSDQEFENESRGALQILIEACVRSRAVVDYEPMIHVQLPAEYTHSWRTRTASEQLRAEIRLSYDLILVSKQTFEHGTRDEKYRLTKNAHVDAAGGLVATSHTGSDGRRWPNDDRPYDVLIPYTPARLDALKAIQAAIKDTRDRLLEFIGDPQQLDQIEANGAAKIAMLGNVR
jgi:hypothetical protein